MATEIKVPDLGTTVEEVRLIRWMKQEGDPIKRGETLCEIETDKAAVDMESYAEGVVLKRLVGDDTMVAIGAVIAYVGQPGETVE